MDKNVLLRMLLIENAYYEGVYDTIEHFIAS